MAKGTTKTAATPKPKSAAKPRSGKDAAGRASPPDRDGDGKSGGSQKGNKTVAAAKGTSQHVLASKQIEQDGLATIKIDAYEIGHRTHHDIAVNGKHRSLKVGVEVKVDAAELEVLENSNVPFTVVTPLDAGGAASAEGSSEAAPAESEFTAPEVSADAVATGDVMGEGGTGGSGSADGNAGGIHDATVGDGLTGDGTTSTAPEGQGAGSATDSEEGKGA